MDRLRDFASRNKRRPFQFSLPNSLSRRHLAQEPSPPLRSQSQASNESSPSVVNLVPVASRSDASTQTEDLTNNNNNANGPSRCGYPTSSPSPLLPSSPQHGAYQGHKSTQTNTAMVPAVDKTAAIKKKEAARKRREKTEQELFELASTMAAQGDALSDRGRDMSNRLNEMARDVLEANQLVERKGTEISALNEQLRLMQLKFDKAHFQLQQAQELAGQVLANRKKSIPEQHDGPDDAQGPVEGDICAIKNWMAEQDVQAWPVDKIKGLLRGLQTLLDAQAKDPDQFKAHSQDIASMIKVFKNVDCDPKYAALFSIATDDDDDPLRRAHQDAPIKQEAKYRWSRAADFSKKLDYQDEDDEDKDKIHDDNLPLCFASMTGPEQASFARHLESMMKDGRMMTLAQEFWKDKMEKITASKTTAAPRAPAPSSSSTKDKNKDDNGPMSSTCNCAPCLIAKWAVGQYGDELDDPEALRDAFLQSISGMEYGMEGFLAAARDMPPEFRTAASDILRFVSDSCPLAMDNVTIRDGAYRLGGTLVPMAAMPIFSTAVHHGPGFHSGSEGLCACCKEDEDAEKKSGDKEKKNKK